MLAQKGRSLRGEGTSRWEFLPRPPHSGNSHLPHRTVATAPGWRLVHLPYKNITIGNGMDSPGGRPTRGTSLRLTRTVALGPTIFTTRYIKYNHEMAPPLHGISEEEDPMTPG